MSNFNSNLKQEILLRQPKTFLRGARIFTSGLKESFRQKKLLALALIPVVVTILALSFGFDDLFNWYFSIVKNTVLNESWFSFWGGWILLKVSKFILGILTGFLVFLTFYAALQIVYIPICSLLAEMVLKNQGILQHDSVWDSVSFNIRMVRTGLIKAVIVFVVGIFCFVGSFIPVLNFLPVAFALLVLSYDCFDYGLELYGLSFGERFLFARKELASIGGHAAVLFFFSFIPGLILLTLPFSVIGASVFIGEQGMGRIAQGERHGS